MFTATATIDVRRPIDEVFAFVADARNRPRWDDSVVSEELTSPEPIGVGTTVRTKLRSMGREYQYVAGVQRRVQEPSGHDRLLLGTEQTGSGEVPDVGRERVNRPALQVEGDRRIGAEGVADPEVPAKGLLQIRCELSAGVRSRTSERLQQTRAGQGRFVGVALDLGLGDG